MQLSEETPACRLPIAVCLSRFRHDPPPPKSSGSCLSPVLRRTASSWSSRPCVTGPMQSLFHHRPFACNLDARPSDEGQADGMLCCVRRPAFHAPSSSNPSRRPDREHRLGSPFPSVPRPSPVAPVVPVPYPLLPQSPFQRVRECTGAAGSRSGQRAAAPTSKPMIPGPHACAQAFPPRSQPAAGC